MMLAKAAASTLILLGALETLPPKHTLHHTPCTWLRLNAEGHFGSFSLHWSGDITSPPPAIRAAHPDTSTVITIHFGRETA